MRVVTPEQNAKAGIDGMGWTVDILAKGSGMAIDKVKPAFQTTTTAGRNPAFPGLVVMLSTTPTTGGLQGKQQNLAKLFQIVGLPDTTGGTAAVGSVQTTPAPSASAGAASASPAASAVTTVTAGNNRTADTTWFVQQATFGQDVDAELTVFVVDGDAPDVVGDRSSLKIVSNEVTVRFHINGSASPAGTAAPTGSASPAASPSASPAGSPSPRASASPSATP